eukprot:g17491.t1
MPLLLIDPSRQFLSAENSELVHFVLRGQGTRAKAFTAPLPVRSNEYEYEPELRSFLKRQFLAADSEWQIVPSARSDPTAGGGLKAGIEEIFRAPRIFSFESFEDAHAADLWNELPVAGVIFVLDLKSTQTTHESAERFEKMWEALHSAVPMSAGEGGVYPETTVVEPEIRLQATVLHDDDHPHRTTSDPCLALIAKMGAEGISQAAQAIRRHKEKTSKKNSVPVVPWLLLADNSEGRVLVPKSLQLMDLLKLGEKFGGRGPLEEDDPPFLIQSCRLTAAADLRGVEPGLLWLRERLVAAGVCQEVGGAVAAAQSSSAPAAQNEDPVRQTSA